MPVRTAAVILMVLLFWCSAEAQFFVVRKGVAPTTRQIATHTFTPDSFASVTGTQMMSRSRHTASSAITSLQLINVGYANTGETANPGTATLTESVEYPPGTCTAATYSSASSGTIPSGGLLVSDSIAITIPAGVTFYTREYYTNASGIPLTDSGDNAHGESVHYGTSGIADQTVSCDAITTTSSGSNYYPAAIIGSSNSPAICIEGDSRASGFDDTYDSSGDVGDIARSIGPTFAYLNLAVKGRTLSGFNSGHAGATSLSAYCTSVIFELGINDLLGAASASTVLSRQQTAYAAFGSLPIWQTTLEPVTTSTDNFTTTANQSAVASAANRISVNDSIRAGVATVKGFFDVANAIEVNSSNVLTQDGGLWGVAAGQNVAHYWTQDGTHGSQRGYIAEQTSGAINTGVLQ